MAHDLNHTKTCPCCLWLIQAFRTAYDELNCGVITREGDRIKYANRKMHEMMGYETGELLGEPLLILVPGERFGLMQTGLREVESGDLRPRVVVFQRKDGSCVQVLAIVQAFPDPVTGQDTHGAIMVELSAVQTAKPAEYWSDSGRNLADALSRVAMELQAIGLSAGVAQIPSIPFYLPIFDGITDREREVLLHLVSGNRVGVIAKRLFISPNTVRNHLKSLYRRLGVRSQSELIDKIRSLSESVDRPRAEVL